MSGYPPPGGYPPQYPAQGYPPQQGGYPPQQGGYPPQQGGYPPQQGGYPPQSGYPPQQGGYPPQQGYPPSGGYPPQQGYPPQGGYPPSGAPGGYPPQGGYPPASGAQGYPPQGGYPPAGGAQGYPPQGGYPPSGAPGGYPPQGGYPPAAGAPQGYPPAAGAPQGYPPAAGAPQGYPPAAGAPQGYPPAAGAPQGYPPAAGAPQGYPPAGAPAGGYPPQQGYPPAQGAYPPQQGGYPPAQPGYPPAQGAYPPAAGAYPPPYAAAPAPGAAPAAAAPAGHGAPAVAPAAAPGATPAAAAVAAKPAITCDPMNDAADLYQAMKGIGTDEATLVRILGHRNQAEIDAIKQAFMNRYSKDLVQAVRSETSGHFQQAMLAVLKSLEQYDSDELYGAMKGLGTDEDTIIEILATRNNSHKEKIKAIFQRDHNKQLDAAISSETSGHFRQLLLGLLQPRDESTTVDAAAARTDAERLYSAGEGRLGTDERTFIEIFSQKSYAHLREVFRCYELTGKHHAIEHAINGEFSGNIKTALSSLATYTRSSPEFWAEQLMNSMKGAGTKDHRLIRILVTQRHHIVAIKGEFSGRYRRSLYEWVNSETSGDYKKILLAIIGL